VNYLFKFCRKTWS